jgi:hypothetical protein
MDQSYPETDQGAISQINDLPCNPATHFTYIKAMPELPVLIDTLVLKITFKYSNTA